MDWKIVEANQLTPKDVDRQGNKLLIGNGYIGYRGTLDEFSKEQKTATIVSGLYDKVGDGWREPVNLPNGCFVQVVYQGDVLHTLTSKVVDHIQTLDIQNAIHERATTLETVDGIRIVIRSRRFASLARRHLICMEYSIRADRECVVDIYTGIDGEVWDLNGPHLREITPSEHNGVISVCALTHENAIPLAVSEVISFGDTGQFLTDDSLTDNYKSLHKLNQVDIQNGFTFHKFIAHCTGLESEDPLSDSYTLCRQARVTGFESLLSEHTRLWSARWADCDIQIEGDAEAQQALRFSIYHLLAIVPMHTATASIPARGMSGQMYKGAIFWDTEIFILPFFTHVFPVIARNLLLYRYHTLEGARRKAKEYGYRGAFYAWESQDTGDDACTLFNVTDVFTNRPMRTYFRDKQVHISADIAYAFWKYFTSTGDASIWREGGAEVVFECARFFLSYIYFNPDKHRYEILDVTGPDEYHERVHNNAFTNRLVAHTFEVCRLVAAHLQNSFPEEYCELIDRLDFECDLSLISEMAQQLYRPDADSSGTVIPQFDGYLTLENVPIKALLERKLHPHEYLGGGNGLATTTQIIKQADVILALYLFEDAYSLETKSANWEYYEPRTEHGSSLSACSYSLIASQIGKVDWAYKYFMKTATIDLTGEGKEYVGTLYIGGTHPAGNGGAWMSAVFGLCGIHISEQGISVNPRLPAHWTQVKLSILFRGQKLRFTISHRCVTVEAFRPRETSLPLSIAGQNYALPPAGALMISIK
ncbi:MAG TPA: glycosyl hydrolase family 65 protein [Anaerolineales bacterium]|nr:glycosyl hydrolase family 65 protein [Anaerolineales bacterium]